MNSKYFVAFVTLVAAQSSSALTVTIDNQTFDNVSRVVIEGDTTSGSTGGDNTNTGGDNTNTGGDNTNTGGDNTNTSGDNTNTGGGSICSSGAVDLSQVSLENGLRKYNFNRGEGYAFSFTGQAGTIGQVAYGASTSRGNGYTWKIATITPCAGGFDLENVENSCARTGIEGAISFQFSNVPLSGYCTLEPGKTYYFNIRNFDLRSGEDTCPSRQLCGFSLQTIRFD